MAYLTLELAKRHCNVDSSFVEDDTYIQSLIEVAEAVVSKDICETLVDVEVEGALPAPLLHAALLLVGNYYANREPVAFANCVEVPLSYKYLIGLYRNYSK